MFSNSVLCTWPGYKRTPLWDGICPSAEDGTPDLARTGLMLKRQALYPAHPRKLLRTNFLYDLLTETKGSFCAPLLFYLTILFYFTEPPPKPSHTKQVLYNRVLPTLLSSTVVSVAFTQLPS